MSWKKWPEWLVGGLIADLVICLIGTIFSIWFGNVYGLANTWWLEKTISLLFFPMAFPLYFGLDSIAHPYLFVLIGTAFTVLLYFLLGSVIGMIVEIESRKKREKSSSEKVVEKNNKPLQ